MAEGKFIQHKGKRILLMDFSNTKDKQSILKTCDVIKKLAAGEMQNSVLGLVDISGTGFDDEISQALMQTAKDNKPYMKITAVVGVEKIKKVIFMGILRFSGRDNMILKDSRQEALDWLVEQ